MSLISDPDYLLQLIRLQYLRHVGDPYGPTTLTFPETFSPHVLQSDLANPAMWPELSLVKEADPVSSSLAAHRGLRHGVTITGRSQGNESKGGGVGAGMRVNSRKSSWKKQKSVLSTDSLPELPSLQQPEGSNSVPLVTVQSPIRTPQQSTTDMASRPSERVLASGAVKAMSSLTKAYQNANGEAANVIADANADANTDANADANADAEGNPNVGRTRPVTFMHHESVSVHDKEISDALRWQAEGPDFEGQLERHHPALSPISPMVAESQSQTENDDSMAMEDTPTDDAFSPESRSEEDPDSPIVETSRPMALPSSTSSSLTANEHRPSMDGSSASISASVHSGDVIPSSQASSLRPNILPHGSSLSSVDPTSSQQSLSSTSGTGTSTGPNTQPEQPKFNGPAPSAAFAQRRERRRVNITGKLLQSLQMSQVQHSANASTGTTSGSTTPTPLPVSAPPLPSKSRARADTDPNKTSLFGEVFGRQPSSQSLRKQVSDMNMRSRASSLRSTSVLQASHNNSSDSLLSTMSRANGSQPSLSPQKPSRSNSPYLTFPIHRKEVVAQSTLNPGKPSGLTAMLSSQSSMESFDNPFKYDYSGVIVRGGSAESQAIALKLFFPASKQRTTPVQVQVRRDATVEEVIGVALYCYLQEDREPPLVSEAEKSNWDSQDYIGKADPAVWNLHIVEDDETGTVDEDFPALDRLRGISAFSFAAFALVQASPVQVEQNRAIQATIQRRPSRTISRPSQLKPSVSETSIHPSRSKRSLVSGIDAEPDKSNMSSSVSTTGMGVSNNNAAQQAGGEEVYLRVRIPIPGLQAVVTTLKVTTQTYLGDVLDTLVKKRKEHLHDAKEWVIMLGDQDIIAPTDRTVESLRGNYSLRLVRKSQVPNRVQQQLEDKRGRLENTNPSASIFKRLSEPAQPKYVTASDVTAPFRRFTVFRKHAMSLGRHERILTIDGDQLIISHTPNSHHNVNHSANRQVMYHIKDVYDCKQSRRVLGSFKLLVYVNRELKRYDFEAENPAMTGEIIAAVQQAKAHWQAKS